MVIAGGSITETVFALGAGASVVGADTSSVYPEEVNALPRVGYQRTLSAEGVLSLHPTLLLVSDESGPAAALDQLRATGIDVLEVPHEPSAAGAEAMIRFLGALLHHEERANELVTRMRGQIDEARTNADGEARPKVMFVYARGPNVIHVAGRGTGADAMLAMGGAENALAGAEGFVPMTAEAVVAAQPRYIVFLEKGLESIGGYDAAVALPGVRQTPAAASSHVAILTFDDLMLLGFGPRTGEAAKALSFALHEPEAVIR